MAIEYLRVKKIKSLPCLPLEGHIDLTYRCNNNCLHCWLRIPAGDVEIAKELSFKEIKQIVDEAKRMGCHIWSISGGEPMLRPDFFEIFDYITANSVSYCFNTNGTLITPKIAKLFKKRRGSKLITLYGATADVHDHITKNPGSFEQTMQGIAYLKEIKAGFMIQLMPMRDSYHQFEDMRRLANSLSRYYRVGMHWLYSSAYGNKEVNQRIRQQRLPSKVIAELNNPDLFYEEWLDKNGLLCCNVIPKNDYLFGYCISTIHNFHIDPYGKATFCNFIREPSLRYDLRKGDFQEFWEKFIPSLANRVRGGDRYRKNCGDCKFRSDCVYCPAYGYLEHGEFSAKIEYVCDIARENNKFKDNWAKRHRRYYRIAEINIQVESDLPITETTFHPKFKHFEIDIDNTIEDIDITIKHHFSLPDLEGESLGKEVYRKPPWAIYRKKNSWIYLEIPPRGKRKILNRVGLFDYNHTHARIFSNLEKNFRKGNIDSLTLFSTDQILLARVLANYDGCYLHSSGVDFNGKGLLFTGSSGVGKSTILKMLGNKAKILCDDRMIIRRRFGHFRIYGTWSNGEIPVISSDSAILSAIFFLNKANENRLALLQDKREITKKLLPLVIKPFVTTDWWNKIFLLIDKIIEAIPCYSLDFNTDGEVIDLLKKI